MTQATQTFDEPLPEKVVKGRSLWSDARRRFFRNKAAVVSLILLIFIFLFAMFGDYIPKLVMQISGTEFPIFDNESVDYEATYEGPSLVTGHLFGMDADYRDLFARVVQGSRISLMVGVLGAFIAVVVGTLYGATAGFAGGGVDNLMMRIVDVLMAIPFMFVLILMLMLFGRSTFMLFVGIGLLSWLDMSRIARGQTLTIKNKEYVEAAIATGVPSHKIILRHIVPNLISIVIIYATLLVPGMIMAESFISFLGLGVQEPSTSWGALINAGAKEVRTGKWWMLVFPLAFFLATLTAFFFVGDGIRDALDPKD